jgi:hypothetical protein
MDDLKVVQALYIRDHVSAYSFLKGAQILYMRDHKLTMVRESRRNT